MPGYNEAISVPQRLARYLEERGRGNAVLLAIIAALGPIGSCAMLGQTVDRLVDVGSIPIVFGGLEGGTIAIAPFPRPRMTSPDSAQPASVDLDLTPPMPVSADSRVEHSETSPSDEALREARQRLAELIRRGAITEVVDDGSDTSAPQASEHYFVQIGSHQVMSAAKNHLGAIRAGFPALLSGLELRVVPVSLVPQGLYFRVQIGPIPSQGAALDLCQTLKARKLECFTLAEPGTAPRPPRAELDAGWASIRPSGEYAATARLEEPPSARAGDGARQIADVMPLYTAPGLPGMRE